MSHHLSLAQRLAMAAALLFIAVIVLGYFVTAGCFQNFDILVSNALNMRSGQSPDWLVALMWGISWIGGGIQRYIIVALLAVALWRWWGWGAGLAMGLTSLLSAFTSDTLKLFFARIRPDLVPQLDPITSLAYPSGHANNAATVYILFIMLVPQARHPLWQATAALLILLTGLSRVMLGVHWPTDVIGGWMLGTSFALGTGAVIAWRQHIRSSHFPSLLDED